MVGCSGYGVAPKGRGVIGAEALQLLFQRRRESGKFFCLAPFRGQTHHLTISWFVCYTTYNLSSLVLESKNLRRASQFERSGLYAVAELGFLIL